MVVWAFVKSLWLEGENVDVSPNIKVLEMEPLRFSKDNVKVNFTRHFQLKVNITLSKNTKCLIKIVFPIPVSYQRSDFLFIPDL